VLLVAVVVLHTLRERIRRLVALNATRLDGSWSARRARREAKYVRKFVGDVLFGSMPLFVLLNGYILLVHSFIPISLAADVVALIAAKPSEGEQAMHDNMIDAKYTQSFTQRGGGEEASHAWMHLLWNFWPLLVLLGIAIVLVGFRILTRTYVASLRELERNAELRRKEYLWGDLTASDAQATSPR
jgi:hypothetical protein